MNYNTYKYSTRINFISFLIFLFFLSSCEGVGSSGNSGNSGSSVDFSGTYALDGVKCYDSSLTVTTEASFSLPTTDILTISGNSFTESQTSGPCSFTTSGNIEFYKDNTMNLSNMTVNSDISGGSCSFTATLTGSSTITPITNSVTYTANQSLPSLTKAAWIYNSSTKSIGLSCDYVDTAGGYCFVVYKKQ